MSAARGRPAEAIRYLTQALRLSARAGQEPGGLAVFPSSLNRRAIDSGNCLRGQGGCSVPTSDRVLPDEADWRRRGGLKSLLTACRSRFGRHSPAGGRGLRQEDAAILTGLSVRSYAALERGAANPSVGLVESVASGLRMTPAERSALHVLATRQDPPMPATPPGGEWPQLSPGLRDLIAGLDPLPAAITHEMWTVMACNQALTALTGGWFDQVPRGQQNLMLFLFSPEGDRLLPEVHAHRRTAVAGLRYQYARNIASNRFAALISVLLDTGPEARDLWERHEIALPQRQCSTRVRHPSRGLIEARSLMTLLSARTWGIGGSQGGKMRQSCLLSPS